jgi:hypothetical protein
MPTTKHRISVTLADDEYGALAQLADQSRKSMSRLTRQALVEFLGRNGVANRARTVGCQGSGAISVSTSIGVEKNTTAVFLGGVAPTPDDRS